MNNETLKLKGSVHYLGKRKDGSIFLDKVVPNTIEAAGKGVITALMLSGVGGTAFNAIAIGIGTGGTTALNSEITTNGGGRQHTGGSPTVTQSQVTTSTSNDTAQWVTTFTFTGSFAITEEGIFNSGTASSGTMLAYQSFAAINVVSGDTVQITHQVVLS